MSPCWTQQGLAVRCGRASHDRGTGLPVRPGRRRGAPTPPAPVPEDGPTWDVLGALPGLASFAVRYDEQLVRGGEPTGPEAMATLRDLGVRTS